MNGSPSSSPDPIVLPSSPPSAHVYRESYGSAQDPNAQASAGSGQKGTPRTRSAVHAFDAGASNSPALTAAARHRKNLRTSRQAADAPIDDVDAGQNDFPTQRPSKRARLSRQPDDNRQSHPQIQARNQDPHLAIDPALLALSAPPESMTTSRSPARTFRSRRNIVASSSPTKWPDVISPIRRQRTQEPPGEDTMANEDFTMITGESLASIKANDSIFSASRGTQKAPATKKPAQPSNAVVYPDLTHHIDDVPAYTPRAVKDLVQPAATQAVHAAVPASQENSPFKQSGKNTVQQDDYPSGSSSEGEISLDEDDGDEDPRDDNHEDDGDDVAADEDGDEIMADLDEDIWAIEASRATEENPDVVDDLGEANDTIPPIFSDTSNVPARSKIPSTWRRASGEDFAYSDSPAHKRALISKAQAASKRLKQAATDVLSPPATDEEVRQPSHNQNENGALHDSEPFDLTEPDAAATQLQQEEENALADMQAMRSPSSSDTDEDVLASNDSGMFWQDYQPTRTINGMDKRKADFNKSPNLSKIFTSDAGGRATQSPAKHKQTYVEEESDEEERQSEDGVNSDAEDDEDEDELAALLPRPTATNKHSRLLSQSPRRPPANTPGISDLLRPTARSSREMNTHSPRQPILGIQPKSAAKKHSQNTPHSVHHTALRVQRTIDEVQEDDGQDDDEDSDEEVEDATDEANDDDHEDEEDEQPSKSYEEFLNVNSPSKVKVKFDDARHVPSQNDPLRPSRAYPSLFDNATSKQSQTKPSDTLQPGRTDEGPLPKVRSEPQPSFLSKITTSLWSAIMRPKGPTFVDPPQQAEVVDWSLASEQEQEFPSTIRARLRAKYGILSNQHPWTLLHMRILHRMFNSVQTKLNSVVPVDVALPADLVYMINTVQYSVDGMPYSFRHIYACVIDAFMQTLVPVSLIKSMERGEVEWLGDGLTASLRGVTEGKRGSELCFDTMETPDGYIDHAWVVSCIGSLIYAIEDKRQRDEQERLELEFHRGR